MPTSRGQHGFSLIELLVVISIIAVLLSLLTSALGSVRGQAKNLVCISNLRQIASAWNLYSNDYRDLFPYDESEGQISGHHMFDWGGVDWYPDEYRTFAQGRVSYHDSPSGLVSSMRPVNPYLFDSRHIDSDQPVFRCPLDDKIIHDGTFRPHAYDFDDLSISEEAEETMYGVLGTSYRANEWIWHKMTPYGRHPGGGTTQSNRRSNVFNPSLFILVGDYGPFVDGRAARNLRNGLVTGWWHGFERCNMAFLDGSVRQIEMTPGTGATSSYSFWLDPTLHTPRSYVYALNAIGTPPSLIP